MISEKILREGLVNTIENTHLPIGELSRGKVRDCYEKGDNLVLVATDRLSAFDVVLTTIPFKGQVLNKLSDYWFKKTKHIINNHVLSVPDPNAMVVVKCEPLPIEMVVRAYLTGVTSTSIWTAYERGERIFCGHHLPDGMKKHQRLENPILTPSTKAEKGQHDRSLSKEEIISSGLVSVEDFELMENVATHLFVYGLSLSRTRGLILVDTKYEFGKTPEGKIVLIDEVHTPDSSRYWYENTYQGAFERGEDPKSFDKEYVRRWLKGELGYVGEGTIPKIPDEVRIEAARRYIMAFEQITNEEFVPNLENPLERLERNLASFQDA